MSPERTKAERQADREAVVAYHEAELAKLLERLRTGFADYDAETIDAFELDAPIHRYQTSPAPDDGPGAPAGHGSPGLA
jgi:hypothetical protein